jgi:hypothetical protein
MKPGRVWLEPKFLTLEQYDRKKLYQKFNPNHQPAGSPVGGEFAPAGSGSGGDGAAPGGGGVSGGAAVHAGPGNMVVNSAGEPVVVHSLDEAVAKLSNGQGVMFERPQEVVTLLNRLKAITDDAKAKGLKAPYYNLCLVYVKSTNFFCSASHKIPRSQMPQLLGRPKPGSIAESLFTDKRGGVDVTDSFIKTLKDRGVKVETTSIGAGFLRATQNELNGGKVATILAKLEAKGSDTRPLVVSKENYLIDGHHRWAAEYALQAGQGKKANINVYRVDMPVFQLLSEAKKFADHMGIKPLSAQSGKGYKVYLFGCGDGGCW